MKERMIPGVPCLVCSQPGHKPSKCPELNPPSGEVNKEDAKYGQAGDDEDESQCIGLRNED